MSGLLMNIFFIFDSLSQVMQVEKECKKIGLNVDIRIAPRNLSSDCGVCINCNSLIEDSVLSVINRIGIEIKMIHRATNG